MIKFNLMENCVAMWVYFGQMTLRRTTQSGVVYMDCNRNINRKSDLLWLPTLIAIKKHLIAAFKALFNLGMQMFSV